MCQWCHSRVIYAFTSWMLVLKVREHVLQYCNNLLNVIFFPTAVLFGHRSVFPLLFNSVVIDYWWRLPLTFRLYFRESRQRKVSFPFVKYVPFVPWHFNIWSEKGTFRSGQLRLKACGQNAWPHSWCSLWSKSCETKQCCINDLLRVEFKW